MRKDDRGGVQDALLIVGVVLLVVVVSVGAYFGYWWLARDTTDRRVGVENRNLGTQTAWRDEALDLMNQADLLEPNAPQRAALEQQACDLIGRLHGPYREDARILDFEAQECL